MRSVQVKAQRRLTGSVVSAPSASSTDRFSLLQPQTNADISAFGCRFQGRPGGKEETFQSQTRSVKMSCQETKQGIPKATLFGGFLPKQEHML